MKWAPPPKARGRPARAFSSIRVRRTAELAVGSPQNENAIVAARRAELAPVSALGNNLLGATTATSHLKAQPGLGGLRFATLLGRFFYVANSEFQRLRVRPARLRSASILASSASWAVLPPQRRRSPSISSSERGQSPRNRRDSARSARSRPPVWQRAQ